MFKEMFKKPVVRKIHSFPMLEKDLTKETWLALFSVGTKVAFDQNVIEHDGGVKEIAYTIEIPCTQEEWDSLNRKLGKLGIDEIHEAK